MSDGNQNVNLKYMPEIDTLYIYFELDTPKIMVPSQLDDRVGIFVDKKTRKRICGYEIEGALKSVPLNSKDLNLSLRQELAVGLYLVRMSTNVSQEDMANEIGVDISVYHNLEKAEQDLSLDSFESIHKKSPLVKKLIALSR